MEMNKCMMVVMLFVAVSQADRIDLTEAVVGTHQYYFSVDMYLDFIRKLVNGDEAQAFMDCVTAEKKSSEPTSYIQLDMLREAEVVSVELLGNSGQELSNFQIHISKEVDADASNLCATQTGNGDHTKLNTYACAQPMKGRYISIISTANKLTLCDIRVNGKLVNPDSFVDLSTAIIEPDMDFLAKPIDKVNDGDLSQDKDNYEDQCASVGWIQIDMGLVQKVGSVEILGLYGEEAAKLKDFEIYVAEKDQTSPSNLCAEAGSTVSMFAYNTYRCQNQMQGRYVTIRKKPATTDYISICEIKINTKGSLNDGVSESSDKAEVSGSSGTCVRRKQCMAKTAA